MDVYLYKNDQQFGPYSVKEVQGFLDVGAFSPIDSVWFEGCREWTTVSYLPGIVISEEMHRQHLVPPFDAYSGDKPFIFVSYSHEDGGLVFREIQRLHEAGYRIWYDEGIDPGNDWPEHIAKAVIDCSLFLMFTSPRSAVSENCRNEVNLALNRKKKFLAIYLEETELPPGLELRMGDLQAILKFKMADSTYRKKMFTGLESLLGEGGRDVPDGEDPVAEAMAIEVVADFLLAPNLSEASPAPVAEPEASSSFGCLKWLWLAIGLTIAASCVTLAVLYSQGRKDTQAVSEVAQDAAVVREDLENDVQELREIVANMLLYMDQTDDFQVTEGSIDEDLEKGLERFREMTAKKGQDVKLKSEIHEATDLESYLEALEQAVNQESYEEAAHLAASKVIEYRSLFDNENGKLNGELLFNGSAEAWANVQAGAIGIYPTNSLSEYEALSSIAKSRIRDVLRYKLSGFTVTSEKRLGRTFYTTEETLLQEVFSFGAFSETRTEQAFDANGNRQKDVFKVVQEGDFIAAGVAVTSYETIRFKDAIQGKMLHDSNLTSESVFLREQVEKYLDEEKRQIRAPLLDLLDALLQNQEISLLFKAYLHDELCRIMLTRGEQWGIPLSSRLRENHARLKAILKNPLQSTDWTSPSSHREIEERLVLFYESLDTISYSEEANLFLNFLQYLSTVSFEYAGHLDELNQPRYLNEGDIPAFTWCIALEQGQVVLQAFPGSNSLPFSPLIKARGGFDEAYQKVLSDLGEGAPELQDLIPFPYSTE